MKRRIFNYSNKNIFTTITKDNNDPFYKIYSKGDIDQIKNICAQKTLPYNFDALVSELKNQGNKLIGLSCKMVKMNYCNALDVERSKIESNMIFLGIIVENSPDKLCYKTKIF